MKFPASVAVNLPAWCIPSARRWSGQQLNIVTSQTATLQRTYVTFQVAQIQLQALEHLKNLPNQQESVTTLNSRLLDVTAVSWPW